MTQLLLDLFCPTDSSLYAFFIIIKTTLVIFSLLSESSAVEMFCSHLHVFHSKTLLQLQENLTFLIIYNLFQELTFQK